MMNTITYIFNAFKPPLPESNVVITHQGVVHQGLTVFHFVSKCTMGIQKPDMSSFRMVKIRAACKWSSFQLVRMSGFWNPTVISLTSQSPTLRHS